MPEYRRALLKEERFFHGCHLCRLSILITEPAREILHQAWYELRERFPFETIAVCLLPDHLHCIWRLPEGDANFPVRWKEIKRLFSLLYQKEDSPRGLRNASRQKKHEAAI